MRFRCTAAPIKLFLEPCGVYTAVIVQNVGISFRDHRSLCVAGVALDGFNVAAAEFELIGRAGVPLWHNKDKSENPCVAMGWLTCPYSFSAKKAPQMRAEEGGDKRGLHIKDKFFQTTKEVKMGSWDITMRQSDYELNLLKIVVKIQLKKVNFSAFNVT